MPRSDATAPRHTEPQEHPADTDDVDLVRLQATTPNRGRRPLRDFPTDVRGGGENADAVNENRDASIVQVAGRP
eukprot:6620684-Pyramimonas_sp.AAC.1